jgi:multidrug efflux pump subunit AcrA (membrane-fusion protein)
VDSVAANARARARRRRRRVTALGAGIVVVAAGTATAVAETGGSGPQYRLADVRRGSVVETVESSGTISASSKTSATFAVSGTVSAVRAHVGQRVAKGQVLARLDTTALQDDVDSARSTLASAKQRRAEDESGQTTGAGSSTTPSASTDSSESTDSASAVRLTAAVTTLAKPTGDTPPNPGNAALERVRAAQAAVIKAQQAVDAGQTDVDTAQQTVDADVTNDGTLRDAQVTACGTTAGTPASVTADCTTAMANYEAAADQLKTDSGTLDQKIAAQDQAVKTLDTAIAALDKAIAQLPAYSTGTGGGSGNPGSGNHGGGNGNGNHGGGTGGPTGGNGTSGGNGTHSGGTGTGTGSGYPTGSTGSTGSSTTQTAQPVSAAQLAADQAAIDAARAKLTAARQDRAAATLRSPVSGKIAEVGLTAGSSAGSNSIMIIGTGVQRVETTVPLVHIDDVKVGQPVSVAADGMKTPLHGTVESIGMLSSTSGSVTTFPVTVELDHAERRLYDGTGADVVITTGRASNVVVVPNSAIRSIGTAIHTVTVMDKGATKLVPVTLGVVGTDDSEVRSGLHAGDRVVVADLSEQLPSSATSGTTGQTTFFGGGGFTGFSRFGS